MGLLSKEAALNLTCVAIEQNWMFLFIKIVNKEIEILGI